jgi:threonine/homoserine/homoserine lactone efflux protein
MGAIDSMTAGRGFILAFLLAGVNPKNLLLAATAGVTIGTSSIGPAAIIVALAIFAIIAVCTVAIPVVAYLTASERMRGPLESLRVWLVKHNATVMSVVLTILSVAVIGKGIANF